MLRDSGVLLSQMSPHPCSKDTHTRMTITLIPNDQLSNIKITSELLDLLESGFIGLLHNP